jgi:DNA-binding NtrC family response regulator
MVVLICAFDQSLRRPLQAVLEMEGYTVTVVQRAADAIRYLERSASSFLLLADNIALNTAAEAVFRTLGERRVLRKRVRVIVVDVSARQAAIESRFHGIIDDFLLLPFDMEHVLGCIESNTAWLPG